MRLLFLLAASVSLVIVGCNAVSGSLVSSPEAVRPPAPSATPAPPTDPPAPSVRPSSAAGGPTPCPTTSPLTVFDYGSAEASCFGVGDVTILGWLGDLPAIGWEPPYLVGFWVESHAIWQRGPGGEAMCGAVEDNCDWRLVRRTSGAHFTFEGPDRWVLVTGHRNDPAAATCRWDMDGLEGPTPDPADAYQQCREEFVATAMRDATPEEVAAAP